MIRFTLILWLALLIAGPAEAQDSLSRDTIRQQLISSCKAWQTCGMYFHNRIYAPRHYELHQMREWREEERWADDRWRWTWNPRNERYPVERAQREWDHVTNNDKTFKRFRQCHDRIIEVLSNQHKSEERAMADAWTQWVANVQFERGALWQEPNNSIQRWSVCAPTDIGDTVTGVVSRFGGKVYGAIRRSAGKDDVRDDGRNLRCRLWARPCPELAEPAETADERKDRRDDYRQRRR